jgi:hypothetical protein
MSDEFLIDIYNKILVEPLKVAGLEERHLNSKSKNEIRNENEKKFEDTIKELKRQNTTCIFNTNLDLYHSKHLIDTCWSFFLGIFSRYIYNYLDFQRKSMMTMCF